MPRRGKDRVVENDGNADSILYSVGSGVASTLGFDEWEDPSGRDYRGKRAKSGSRERDYHDKKRDKDGRKRGIILSLSEQMELERLAAATAVLCFAGSLFFGMGSITGNVVGDFASLKTQWIASGLFVAGIVSTLVLSLAVYLKRK